MLPLSLLWLPPCSIEVIFNNFEVIFIDFGWNSEQNLSIFIYFYEFLRIKSAVGRKSRTFEFARQYYTFWGFSWSWCIKKSLNIWNFLRFSEIFWDFMRFYEILWNFMRFYEILRNFMRFHDFFLQTNSIGNQLASRKLWIYQEIWLGLLYLIYLSIYRKNIQEFLEIIRNIQDISEIFRNMSFFS